MTIRTRLTLFFAGLMLALVATLSGGVYFFERSSQRRTPDMCRVTARYVS